MLLFIVACSLLYLLKIAALLYTNNQAEGLKHLQRTSALVILPLAIYVCKSFINKAVFRKLIVSFALILAVACLYCLIIAILKYISLSNPSVFFYHQLVKPISQHAIQFSILLFIASIYLLKQLSEEDEHRPTKYVFWLLMVLFTLFLVLLSSKLIIVVFFFYLAGFFVTSIAKNQRRIYVIAALCIPLILIATLLTMSNPVTKRFSEIFTGNTELVRREKFDPGVYFNGLQFRLLQWRLVHEILTEEQAWIKGLSPGDAQSALDQKYIELNMYTGSKDSEDTGFLGYHTHNQFLQALIQNGIIGLAAFLFVCYSLINLAQKSRNKEFRILIVLLLLYCFADAILETQYGLVIFCFFPVFCFAGNQD